MPIVIVVDGAIGAGKTTIIHDCIVPGLLDKGWRVTIVPEPVEKWKRNGLLERYYSNIKLNAYLFQTQAFHDRVRECQKAWNVHKDTDVYILERSILSDKLFVEMLREDGMFDDLQYQCYLDWWNLWSSVMPFTPNLFVYIRTSLDKCMERISMRARSGESCITPEYEMRLISQHDAFFGGNIVKVPVDDDVYQEVPCLHIDNDSDHRENATLRQSIVDRVEKLIVSCKN